ncbi:MAG: cell division protein [Bacteroidia bacterium]|nr:MAG: cell division protein [Bacteroidia bacterium]
MSTPYKGIEKCLLTLIETQDFIVIPNFGALVMQHEPAELSAAQNIIFPPRKKVLFNPLLKHNDGLLISELQKELGIEYTLAETLLSQFVNGLNVLLDTKRRADIEGIGFFYKDTYGNILFESTLNPFYLSESFGLFPISAAVYEKETILSPQTKESSKTIIRFEPKNWYKAAVVLLIVSLFFVYWWISPFDLKNSLSNMIGTKRHYTPKITHTPYPVICIKYDVPHKNKPESEVRFNHTTEKKDVSASVDISKKEINVVYSIIAGCFRVQENANKLLADYRKKGLAASIKWNAEKQMYVVSLGSFKTKEQSLEYLENLRKTGVVKDAWIKEEK